MLVSFFRSAWKWGCYCPQGSRSGSACTSCVHIRMLVSLRIATLSCWLCPFLFYLITTHWEWPHPCVFCHSFSCRFQQCPWHHNWPEKEPDRRHSGSSAPQGEDGADIPGKTSAQITSPESGTGIWGWEYKRWDFPILGSKIKTPYVRVCMWFLICSCVGVCVYDFGMGVGWLFLFLFVLFLRQNLPL